MSDKHIADCIFATQHGDLLTVTVHVLQNRVSPNATDDSGCSLLHWAAINQRYDVAVFLISQGANLNYAGGDLNETPLQWAVRSHYLPIIDLLIQNRADLHHKSRCGYDALHLACHSASTNIVCLLLMAGANPSSLNDDHETVLFWFIRNKGENLDIVRLLLKFNIDLFVLDKQGDNVLHSMFMVSAMENTRAIDWTLCYTILEGSCRLKNRHDEFVDPEDVSSDQHPVMQTISSTSLFNAFHLLIGQKNADGKCAYKVAMEKKHKVIFVFLFDFFTSKLLNRYWVNFFAAVLMMLLFVCVHLFSWAFGIMVFTMLFLMADFIMQKSVPSGKSRKLNGDAWGIILSLTAGHFIYIQEYVSGGWGVLVLVLVCAIFWSLYTTMMTKPKVARPDKDRLALHKAMVASQVHYDLLAETKLMEPFQYSGNGYGGVALPPVTTSASTGPSSPAKPARVVEEDGEDSDEHSRLLLRYNDRAKPVSEPMSPPSMHSMNLQHSVGAVAGAAWYDAKHHYDEHFRLCSTCLLNKTELHSGTHCMYCDECHVDLDHHCHFVDNCVGVGNRRSFTAFLFFASTGCFTIACLYHHVILHHYCLDVRETVMVASPSAATIFTQIYYSLAHEFALAKCAFSNKPVVLLLLWVAITMTVWIGLLFIAQITMVAVETTTYEAMKGVQKNITRMKTPDALSAEAAAARLVTFPSIVNANKPLAEKASNLFCFLCCSPAGLNNPYSNTHNKVVVGARNLYKFLATGVYKVTQSPPILVTQVDDEAVGLRSSNSSKAEEVRFNSSDISATDDDTDIDSVDVLTPINRSVESSAGKYTMKELSAMDRNAAKKL